MIDENEQNWTIPTRQEIAVVIVEKNRIIFALSIAVAIETTLLLVCLALEIK